MRCRPARGDAADQRRLEPRQPLHPAQRFLALRAQLRDVRVAAEQRVVVDERRLDLVVARQRGAAGSISCRAALRLASDQSAMPCSAMSFAATCAMRVRSCASRPRGSGP